ncbi:MAG: ethanolamine utilization protein EutN [Ectothiorhodospiraceae bacterium]|nr:ethanolamine utilization protein EutN [Ectothiorhodospiraceae bacterium]
MFFAKIIGTVWATVKDEHLQNASFEIIQPIDANRNHAGKPIIAVNNIGAGEGETVMYITASEASIPLPAEMAPTDATIVGIVDRIDVDPELNKEMPTKK